ncbi:hypothetical protein [Dethiothermospora halolimnae]|uniref:hypothetical protein n=1 Tax=Dethiothermospora halolimnae TaxID=3114390 RepID=UPI003CCB9988
MFLKAYRVKMIVAIIFTAFVIKMIDDYIDDDNKLLKKLIYNMGTGVLPYGLIIFSMACLLDKEVSISLLFSAYIIGMFSDLNRKLSFKIKGYQEGVLVFLVGTLLIGLYPMISSFLIMLLLQLIDDIIDLKLDRMNNNSNLVDRFGLVEVILFSLIIVLILIKINIIKLIVCLIVFLVFAALEVFWVGGKKDGSHNL